MKKSKPLLHRKRRKSVRLRAKQKAKLERRRLRASSGARKTYR